MSEFIQISKVAANWLFNGRTGISSEAIFAHMVGVKQTGDWSNWPHDPDDFSRCERLLQAVPEWRERIPEMAQLNKGWALIAPRWEEVRSSMENECGLFWEKQQRAPETYKLMKQILKEEPTNDR